MKRIFPVLALSPLVLVAGIAAAASIGCVSLTVIPGGKACVVRIMEDPRADMQAIIDETNAMMKESP